VFPKPWGGATFHDPRFLYLIFSEQLHSHNTGVLGFWGYKIISEILFIIKKLDIKYHL
jgi:hypothetical protein